MKIIKTSRLTKLERSQIVLPNNLKDILIGLLLGDLYAQKRSTKGNTLLRFEQGFLHKEYIDHLYDLFKSYCVSEPKVANRLPNKVTGKIYTRVTFNSMSLPCFNELHNLFYQEGKKVVPDNIGEILTPLGLAYWIADDGSWDHSTLRLYTNGYTLEEVNLLAKTLTDNFNLICTIIKDEDRHTIRIACKSVSCLQTLLTPIMPPMMKYKIQGK
jgi:hypothetical protein